MPATRPYGIHHWPIVTPGPHLPYVHHRVGGAADDATPVWAEGCLDVEAGPRVPPQAGNRWAVQSRCVEEMVLPHQRRHQEKVTCTAATQTDATFSMRLRRQSGPVAIDLPLCLTFSLHAFFGQGSNALGSRKVALPFYTGGSPYIQIERNSENSHTSCLQDM